MVIHRDRLVPSLLLVGPLPFLDGVSASPFPLYRTASIVLKLTILSRCVPFFSSPCSSPPPRLSSPRLAMALVSFRGPSRVVSRRHNIPLSREQPRRPLDTLLPLSFGPVGGWVVVGPYFCLWMITNGAIPHLVIF